MAVRVFFSYGGEPKINNIEEQNFYSTMRNDTVGNWNSPTNGVSAVMMSPKSQYSDSQSQSPYINIIFILADCFFILKSEL